MLARGHASSGMAAGAAVMVYAMPALGVATPAVVPALILGVLGAGWSLANDIDTERATASTAFGPISKLVHHVAAWASVVVIGATGTRYDEPREHRGLTHCTPFAALMGLTVFGLGTRWPVETLAVVFAVAVAVLARLSVTPFLSSLAGLAGAAAIYFGALQIPPPAAVGITVFLAMMVHNLGDMVTKQGVPLWAPIVKVRGRRWWNVRIPLWLAFRAGAWQESVLIVVFVAVTLFCLLDVATGITT